MKADSSRLQRIGQIAQKHVAAGEFSNVEWCVEHNGDVVSRGAIGQSNALDSVALTENPLYRIYSMTKPVISVLALKMVEAGVIGLAHPVALYLPAAASLKRLQDGTEIPVKSPVTIEHLLTHRAGLTYDFLPNCAVALQYGKHQVVDNGSRTLAEMVDTVLQLPLCAEPGSEWRYSVSIDVLGRVLEVATGKPLQQLLTEELLQPCGMSDTGFQIAAEQQNRLVQMFGQKQLGDPMTIVTEPQKLYQMDVDKAHPVASETFVRGGHGLYSSANDYMRFLPVLSTGKTLDGEVLLSAPMVDMMWRNRIPDSQRPLAVGYNPLHGYGWNLCGRVMTDTGQALSLTANGEGGWAGAASTYFWVDRENSFSGVVMTQYLGATVPVGDNIRNAAYQSLV